MASKIGMASNALVLLGDSPISSFDDGGAGATALANLYESTYTDLLTSHHWRFARKMLDLSKKSSSPLFGYDSAYALPSDCLRIIQLESGMNYEVVGDELHTDDASAQLKYIYRVDEGDIPPYFEQLVQFQLAAVASLAVTDRTNLYQTMAAEADRQFQKAAGVDSQESTTVAIQNNPLVDVRG